MVVVDVLQKIYFVWIMVGVFNDFWNWSFYFGLFKCD